MTICIVLEDFKYTYGAYLDIQWSSGKIKYH